jgi:dephospho-CoA kinase
MENKKHFAPLILGITGAFGSGKSTASTFFADRGFTRIVLSSFLEEEAKKRGQTVITRKILQDIGNEWREQLGADVLAKKALEKISNENLERVVIDGIRNSKEIALLRDQEKFKLIAIVVNRKLRFERLQQVKRREEMTSEVFNALDFRDLGIGEKESGLQVAICIALADVFIDNNGTPDEFEDKLKLLYTDL